MEDKQSRYAACQICKKSARKIDLTLAAAIRPRLAETIKKNVPSWDENRYICRTDLNKFRREYIEHVLEIERGEISSLDQDVVKSLSEHEILAKNTNGQFEGKLTFGQRLADKVASFGGSWTFILIFFSFLASWIFINGAQLFWRPFDPFPFILLNLTLSTLAALQAPIIMMSQNRKEQKDRLRGEHDYQIDLKAELEIRHLHEKIDHLAQNQWQRLLEIQQLQLEMLEDMNRYEKLPLRSRRKKQ